MDREELRKLIKTSSKPPMLEKVTNMPLHSAYRVVVYRMNTKGLNVNIPPVGHRSLDYLLNLDPSNRDYVSITDAISNDSTDEIFMNILDALYGKLRDELDNADVIVPNVTNRLRGIYRAGNLVDEYDITPLVGSGSINLDMEGLNTCSLTCIDPSLVSFKMGELKKVFERNPWLQIASGNNPEGFERLLGNLKNFKFREYDLIRVYTYSSLTQTISEKVEELRKTFNAFGRDELVSLLTEYSLLPAFTGFVQGINNTTTANTVSTVSVNCAGVSRVLAQTSMVIDQAEANQVVLNHPKLAGSIMNNRPTITPNANIFSGRSALEVFHRIIDGVLYPKVERAEPNNPDKNDPIAGVPSLSKLYDRATKEDLPENNKVNVIPLFPSIVALHYVKEKFSEMIYFCDDALTKEQKMFRAEVDGVPITHKVTEVLSMLRPYLLMLKNNFELFESTYQSPYDIVGTIRANTYMEVFEDRSGTFRFRFPKYNNAVINHPLPLETISSININRSDSNNFSVVQVRFMADLLDAVRAVVPDVFMDGLSVLRFGFRVSAPIQNPNAISTTFSKYLARFIKYYSTLRESRTADITLGGSALVDLGQMVSFRYGYRSDIADFAAGYRNAGVSPNSTSYDGQGDYVGYVTNISENFGVDQIYQQSLTLKFVRDTSISEGGRTDEMTEVYGTPAWVVAQSQEKVIPDVLPLLQRLFIPNRPNTFSVKAGTSSSVTTLLSYKTEDAFVGAFNSLPSAWDLAGTYRQYQDEIDAQARAAKKLMEGAGKVDEDTKVDNRTISQIEDDIEDCYRHIGIMRHQVGFLDNFSTAIRKDLRGKAISNLKQAIVSAFTTTPIEKYMGQGADGIKSAIDSLATVAYNHSNYNSVINIQTMFPGQYGQRTISVTRGDYNPLQDQVIQMIQSAHIKKEGEYGYKFAKEIEAFGTTSYDKTQAQLLRWYNVWDKFADAADFQKKVLQDASIPFYTNRVIRDVQRIVVLKEKQKKAGGEIKK